MFFFYFFCFLYFFFDLLYEYFLETIDYENFILKPYNFLDIIYKKCPFVGNNYLKIFSDECDNMLFKITGNLGISDKLYNLLVSVLWRLSYNFEIINIIVSNNFRPFFSEVTDLSKNILLQI